MNISSQLQDLLAQLAPGAGVSPGKLAPILRQLLALLSAVAEGGASLDRLKKPGAWRSHPLPPNTVEQPYYVTVPSTIEITNLTPAQLVVALQQPEARPRPDGRGNTVVTIPAPLLRS